jgi:hypothetical protein
MAAETYSFFSVEFYDEATGTVVHELYLENVEDKLPRFIRQRIREVEADQSEPLEWTRLMEHPEFRVELGEWHKLPIRLRHESSVLPYRMHGGREFDLMMKGLKPLSVFSHVDRSSAVAGYLSRYFEPLVERGKLVSAKLDDGDGDDASTAPTLMFALPNEAWRIEAYRLMARTARATHWNDALERIEGSLLGYTPEQNNSWMSYRMKMGYRWGLQTLYRFLTEAEVDFVRKTGCKAFPIGDDPVRLYLLYDHIGENDPTAALAKLRPMTLARFYAPMIKFMEFSQGTTRGSNIDFQLFELPGSGLARLNELIEGTIDIITLPVLGA